MFPTLRIGSVVFYSFGMMVGIAILVGGLLFRADFERRRIAIPIKWLMPALVVAGIVGSKLDVTFMHFWLRETSPSYTTLRQWLASGHTWFGAELGGLMALALLGRIYGQPILRVYDALPVLSLSHAIGRVGCFLAGDGDYGPVTSLPWGISFPHGLVPTNFRVHPTMLYVAVIETAFFLFLWPKGRPAFYQTIPAGTIFAQYLVLTGAGRIVTELVSNNPAVYYGFTEAQVVGSILVTVGVCLLIRLHVTVLNVGDTIDTEAK